MTNLVPMSIKGLMLDQDCSRRVSRRSQNAHKSLGETFLLVALVKLVE
jgi:hypothetical protein